MSHFNGNVWLVDRCLNARVCKFVYFVLESTVLTIYSLDEKNSAVGGGGMSSIRKTMYAIVVTGEVCQMKYSLWS